MMRIVVKMGRKHKQNGGGLRRVVTSMRNINATVAVGRMQKALVATLCTAERGVAIPLPS